MNQLDELVKRIERSTAEVVRRQKRMIAFADTTIDLSILAGIVVLFVVPAKTLPIMLAEIVGLGLLGFSLGRRIAAYRNRRKQQQAKTVTVVSACLGDDGERFELHRGTKESAEEFKARITKGGSC